MELAFPRVMEDKAPARTMDCPGCGLAVAAPDIPAASRFNASSECLELFRELSGIHFDEADPSFIHQIALDCYGAQHVCGPAKPITTAYSLIGLCLHIEHGFTGRQVQRAHTILARKPATWPELPAPTHRYPITVASVVACEHAAVRTERLEDWARSTWDAWRNEHMWVRSIIRNHRLAACIDPH